jgi:hypothetical protein
MNVLILTAETAEDLINKQTGQHRLGPVQLTDGRYFLIADVLDEPLYQGKLDETDYETVPFENIAALVPWQEEWTTELVGA